VGPGNPITITKSIRHEFAVRMCTPIVLLHPASTNELSTLAFVGIRCMGAQVVGEMPKWSGETDAFGETSLGRTSVPGSLYWGNRGHNVPYVFVH
jgi:hypothetical protein